MSRLFEYTAMASIARRDDVRLILIQSITQVSTIWETARELSVFGLLVDVIPEGLRVYPENSPRRRCAHIKVTHTSHPHHNACYVATYGNMVIAVYAAGDA